MNTAARVASVVQEGIRNFERPPFVDQLGMASDRRRINLLLPPLRRWRDGRKTFARSSMQEGMKTCGSTMQEGMKERQSAITSLMKQGGQALDLDPAARMLRSAISSPP